MHHSLCTDVWKGETDKDNANSTQAVHSQPDAPLPLTHPQSQAYWTPSQTLQLTMNKPYDACQQSLDFQKLCFGPVMATAVIVEQVRVEGLSGKDTQEWYHGEGLVLEVYQLGPSQPLSPSSWLPGDLMTYDSLMTQNWWNGVALSLHIHPGIKPMVRT